MKQEPAGLPERGLPRECSGPIPRIRRWVFVCCCAPEVWCYCDRKRGRRGEGGRPPAGDVPVKSLCPCRALSCEFPQRGESRLCAAAGLPTCESPGPSGVSRGTGAERWQGPCLLLSPGWGPSQQCPVAAGLLRCPWAVGCSRMLLAGRLRPCGHPAWGLRVDRVSACSPAAWLPSCAPLLPANAQGSSSPLLSPWCSIQPVQRVGSFPALLEGRSSWHAVSRAVLRGG